MTRCERKRRYRDRIAALLALASTMPKSSGRRDEIRAYRCPHCAGWHLTSKTRTRRAKA